MQKFQSKVEIMKGSSLDFIDIDAYIEKLKEKSQHDAYAPIQKRSELKFNSISEFEKVNESYQQIDLKISRKSLFAKTNLIVDL